MSILNFLLTCDIVLAYCELVGSVLDNEVSCCFVHISVACGCCAYILYLTFVKIECECGNYCVSVGSGVLYESILTVLQTCELSRVSGEFYFCNIAECLAAVDADALESNALILGLEKECSLACVCGNLLAAQSLLVDCYCRSQLVLYLKSLAVVLLDYISACYCVNVCNNTVVNCEVELCNYFIAGRSSCLFEAVLAVLETCKVDIVACEFVRCIIGCESL